MPKLTLVKELIEALNQVGEPMLELQLCGKPKTKEATRTFLAKTVRQPKS